MEDPKKYKSSLLHILSYSLICVAVLVLGVLIYSGMSLNQFLSVNPVYSAYSIFNSTYLPLAFLMSFILSLAFILMNKLWAYYLFFLLNIGLVGLLFFQSPIDWVNIALVMIITLIFGFQSQKLHRFKKTSSKDDKNLDKVLNKKE